jgi:hypothetical protein
MRSTGRRGDLKLAWTTSASTLPNKFQTHIGWALPPDRPNVALRRNSSTQRRSQPWADERHLIVVDV